ncbi:DUF11 domain-containing protein [Blastopirellula sp. JC732]|uniref:DUF11 domain-containing protein n=1 Tax=Blastopirellula sediminis TaxID=2894196 RepID=A0A9X1SM11_9BACT|nr:DUF11 domain-containing protein [Blastopirellula sediminis]MCC9605471.1 DUF11 domain-containing protein [Blastopirellula sediminis]MCC9631229.1 DUF11 domain-containing protein [Blastopirellula sediminis]
MKLRNLRQLALLAAAMGLLTLPACKITDVKTTYGPTKPMTGVSFNEGQPAQQPEMTPPEPQYAAAPPVQTPPAMEAQYRPAEAQYPVQLTSGEQPIDMPPPEQYYQHMAPVPQQVASLPCRSGFCRPGFGGGYNCGPGGCGPGGCGPYGCNDGMVSGEPMPCNSYDEWVCDGGDSHLHTKIGDDFSIRGLDIEDTVVHYDTLAGCREVCPSNKVCIYAPRFAAVRKIYGLNAELTNEGLIANDANLKLQGQINNGIPTNVNQPVQPVANLGPKMAQTFRDRTLGVELANQQILIEFVREFQAFEDFNIMKVGIFDATEKLVLATSIQNAIAWTENQAVQVMIEGRKAHELESDKAAQEAVMFDLDGKPCIRIVKVASVADAQPGDIVEFTLRFDNLGDQRVGNVTILDNLSPRLELVEGSAQCSVDADFLTQPNEKDSLVLRWEIKQPLDVGEGGVCRFKCKVR